MCRLPRPSVSLSGAQGARCRFHPFPSTMDALDVRRRLFILTRERPIAGQTRPDSTGWLGFTSYGMGGHSQSPPTPIPRLWCGTASAGGGWGAGRLSSFAWPRRNRARRDRMGQSPHRPPPCPSYVGGSPLRLRLELPLMMSGGCMCGPPRGSAGLTRLAAPQVGCKGGLLPVGALMSGLAQTLAALSPAG